MDMKREIKMQYFRGFLVLALTVAIYGCQQYDTFKITEKPYVDRTSVELFIGADAGDRNTAQLKSSPEGVNYTWTSLDPSVATVTQNGVITALKEGFAIITVASENDVTNVNVWVRTWIPLVDFDLDQDEVIKFWMDRFRINVKLEPSNTTESDFIQWYTTDPDVAAVSGNGWVTCYNKGTAIITARTASGIEKTVQVSVLPQLSADNFIPRDDWTFPGYVDNSGDGTIGYSSQENSGEGGGTSPNGRVIAMIDGNLNSYWHSRWTGAGSSKPHWFIVDLKQTVELTGIMLQQRQNDNRGVTGFQFFTCASEPTNQNDPVNGYEWVDLGSFTLAAAVYTQQRFPLYPPFPKARYVKVYIGTNVGGGAHAMFSEFGLFGETVE